MRIVFVVPVLDVSGGARIIAGHARRLAERGHEVLIVAPTHIKHNLKTRLRNLFVTQKSSDVEDSSHYHGANVPIRLVSGSGPILAKHLPDADAIVATWWETAEWVAQLPVSKGQKFHFIQHYEAFPGQPTTRVENVWRLPTIKLAVAQWLVDLGREKFGLTDITLVPNSVDHELFSFADRMRRSPPTIGFLFHEAAFKDVDTSIRAVEILRGMIPDFRLVSFGGSIPAPGRLPPGTAFAKLPQQQEIAAIYTKCDVWISTSRTEGFNLPVLEAMACGTPVVSTPTGRPAEVIADGINGYKVEPNNPDGVAKAVYQILSCSPEKWMEMSVAAWRAASQPNWEESVDLFEQALLRGCRDKQARAIKP